MISIEEELMKYLNRGVSLIEASTEISRIHSIEIETVANVISNNNKLKSLSFREACELRLMKDNKVGTFPK